MARTRSLNDPKLETCELGERAEDLQHEPAHRVVAGRGVGVPLCDERDAGAPSEDLVDELLKIDQGSSKAIH